MNRDILSRAAALFLILVVSCAPVLRGQEASLTRAEIENGWILLFDGVSPFGLTSSGPLAWRTAGGVLSADGAGSGYIRTTSQFSDFVLKMDVRFASPATVADLSIRSFKDAKGSDKGYRIRVGDGDPDWPTGSVVSLFKATASHPAANQWHTLQIEAQDDRIAVLLDGNKVSEGHDTSARTGYIGWKVNAGSKVEFRNIKLNPAGSTSLFNGTDLSGWKPVASAPPNKPGLLQKIIPFAGKPKPSRSQWSVQGGLIHGEKGPGQLETSNMYDDFILQFELPPNKQHRALYIRGDAGKIFTGYKISMDPARPGEIAPHLAVPRRNVSINDVAVGTVAASGRHLEVWINGFPVTDFLDTRPLGATTVQSAKTAAGTVGLSVQDASADYKQIKVALLPVNLGSVPPKAAPAPAEPVPVPSVPAPAAAAVNPPAETEADREAKQQSENREKSARLMSEALRSTDPAQQMQLYDQVIQLDPTNAGAAQGYKEARDKLARQQEELQKQSAEHNQQAQDGSVREDALRKAQHAFLANDLAGADRQLAIAERVAPNDSAVRDLRQRIDHAREQARVRRLFGFGAGGVAIASLFAFLFLRSRKKHGYLQLISDSPGSKTRRYDLDRPVISIGAIAQDGSDKNDIVIGDLQRKVSRFHCQIHQDKGKFYVVDCNSANGTRIDKTRLRAGEPGRLRDGAQLELGGTTTFRFGLERRKPQKS